MNVLVLDINGYSPNGFHFLDTKPNIIMDGVFTKLVYVDANFTMNSVFIRCTKIDDRKDTKYMVLQIEKELLSQYMQRKQVKKKAIRKMEAHLLSGKVKVDDCQKLILKISGIWETEDEYGLTYKFFPILN
jgi:hypothetical protein